MARQVGAPVGAGMTDRELSEDAARAAGIKLIWPRCPSTQKRLDDIPPRRADTLDNWDPLADDGDALRLATALKLNISQGDFSVCVDDEAGIEESALVRNDAERTAVVRRAIVRAAAAMAQTERTA